MRIKWLKEGLEMIPLDEELKKKIEKWAAEVDPEELKIVCPLIDPYVEGGKVVKIVKHRGKYMVTAGIYEQGGYAEEYYIAVLFL